MLHAQDHPVVNFLHLVVVLASVKQLRKCASDIVIRYFREELQQRTWGEGSVQGRPYRVLLCSTSSIQKKGRDVEGDF